MGVHLEAAALKALETTQYLSATQGVQKTNIQEAQDYMRIKSELKDYIKPQNLKKFRQKEVQKRELQIQQQLDHHQINQEQDSRKVIEKSVCAHDSNLNTATLLTKRTCNEALDLEKLASTAEFTGKIQKCQEYDQGILGLEQSQALGQPQVTEHGSSLI